MIRFEIDGNAYTTDQLPCQGGFYFDSDQEDPTRISFVLQQSIGPRVKAYVPCHRDTSIESQDVVSLVNILLIRQAEQLRAKVLQEVRTKLEEDRQVVLNRLKAVRKQIQDDEAAALTLNATLNATLNSLRQLEEK